jgi:hypothetical protein
MTKLVAGLLAVAVSAASTATMAQTVDSKMMATPSASDEGVRSNVLAAAKAEPKSVPTRNSMMATPSASTGPAPVAQSSAAAVRGVAPH